MVNGIQDESSFIIPEFDIPQEQIIAEKQSANFAHSKEFEKLKEHFESRILFYQKFLPDGRPLTEVDPKQLAEHWVIANAVIGEFNLVINSYMQIAETIKNAKR